MRDLAKEIETQHWIVLGVNGYSLYITIYPPLYTFGFKRKYGFEADVMYVAEGQKAHWYMRSDQLDRLAEHVLPALLQEGWQWYEQCMSELAEFQVFHETFLSTDLSSMSDEALLTLMCEYRERFEAPFTTNNAIEALSYYFQHRLTALLEKEGLDTERIDELIAQYGQSARPNYVKECAQEYRTATDDAQRENVRKKYYYVLNDYVGPHELTHEELQELVIKYPYDFSSEVSTVGISAGAQAHLRALQVVSTVQDVRKAGLLEMVFAAHRFGEEFARRKEIPFEDAKNATWEEIENNTWSREDLIARRDPFVMFWSLDGRLVYQGKDAAAMIALTHTHILKLDETASEIRGVSASKGNVRGRVVVVFKPEEFARVQEGDVLVTIMTRPEFLPVMYRAAAFVCDEGGLTSHAAIVARELKKPCIVATRIGTRTFKDGDIVEVDADKGIVRIIEKS